MHRSLIACLALLILLITPPSSADDSAAVETVRLDDTFHAAHEEAASAVNSNEEDIAPSEPEYPRPVDIVSFSKRMYSSLATGDANTLAERFKPTFNALNHDGNLGHTLDILYDMRLMDLQASVGHARKMKDVIEILKDTP